MDHVEKTRSNTPAFYRLSPVHIDGAPSQRLMIVLRTRGCEYAKAKHGGCTVCGFLNHADENIEDRAIETQLDTVLADIDATKIKEIDLLTLGSFLNDNEISPPLRQRLLARVDQLENVRRVSFESRAEYLTLEKLCACRDLLGDRRVEFGIGLESANDQVRNVIIKKGLPKQRFLRVIDLVAEARMSLLVYLLIKPPGLSEMAAIEDAVASARFVFKSAADRGVQARVAFEPVFVCENTVLESLFSDSRYRLVNLWSVVEVMGQIHGQGEVFVGLSDEGLANDRTPGSCDNCSSRLIAAIERYNGSQDIEELAGIQCACRADYERALHERML